MAGDSDKGYPMAPLVPALVVDVCVSIADYLDAQSLLCIRATSRVGDTYTTFILQRRIRFFVGRCMPNFPSFMRNFEDLRCVITGKAALHILYPWHTPPAHIDIYVPKGNAGLLKNHLLRRQDFHEDPTPPNAAHPILSGVCHAKRAEPLDPPQIIRTIRLRHDAASFCLHECLRASTLDVVLSQWNTALLNFVSTQTFCVAYPKLTRSGCALITPSHDDPFDRESADWVVEEHQRWAEDGWKIAGIPATWEPSGVCPGGRRAGCAAEMRFWGHL